jgi:PAS domain S-box-containing protein
MGAERSKDARGSPGRNAAAVPQGLNAASRLFDLSSELLGIASPDGYFTSLNPAWERTLGFDRDALMAQPFIEFVHPGDRERTAAAAGTNVHDFRNRYARKDGGWRWLSWRSEVGEDGSSYFVARDVTAEVAAEQRRRMLTSLVERADDAILSKTVDGVITTWNRGAEELYGYSEAEAVGRAIEDLIIPRGHEGESATIVGRLVQGNGVRQYTTERCRKDGSIVNVALTASLIRNEEDEVIGVAVISRDMAELELDQARVRSDIDTVSWVGRLRDAIDEGRLVFHTQPIVGLRGQPRRQEILCRVLDRGGKVIAPVLFLPAAERYGLMEEIDHLAIRQAVRLIANGQATSVNISAASVTRAHTATFIGEELNLARADPGLLTVELTETALMNDLAAAKRFTERISELGCTIALDDFGTGFGGFTYLKRLNIDEIKIDTEFVRDLPTSEASQHVVEAVTSLAKRFGLQTVAEGVEDEATLSMLDGYGVDFAQGYFLGRPGPV